jgi:RND family efflux transporter MFP subunit
MSEERRRITRRFLILPPIVLGALLLGWQLVSRAPPEREAPGELAQPVRVLLAEPLDYVPRALGYGHVEPGREWDAVTEVAGRIVYRHPDLEAGRVLAAGTTLLRIDPADYELAIAGIESELESFSAQLSEIEVRERNTKALLSIERRAAKLAGEDVARKKTLLARGNAAQATVDAAERESLVLRQRVQELENQLNLLPAERRVIAAQTANAQAKLARGQLDLARTEILLPFDARIAEVMVETTQFVRSGDRLAQAHSMDVAEVAAQFPIERLRPLIERGDMLGALEPGELSVLPQRWGLGAEVRLTAGDFTVRWPARFDRLAATIDPQTRTLGVIVAVDNPYGKVIPGERPPLVKNMFVEVELRAPKRKDVMIVPRVAVHRDDSGASRLYLADEDDRLRFRPVTLASAQSDFVVVAEGLEGGERVIVSDIIPAIEGMRLDPVVDADLAARLRAAAQDGEGRT